MNDVGGTVQPFTCCGERSALDASGHPLWGHRTQAWIAAFHAATSCGTEQRRVEAAIIDLASEHLWHEFGHAAAWELFDVVSWRDRVLAIDVGYQQRVRVTLTRFYAFLGEQGHVAPREAKRIALAIDACFSATPASLAAPRESFVRPTGNTQAAVELPALARAIRR
jgi:hypothetical protein